MCVTCKSRGPCLSSARSLHMLLNASLTSHHEVCARTRLLHILALLEQQAQLVGGAALVACGRQVGLDLQAWQQDARAVEWKARA